MIEAKKQDKRCASQAFLGCTFTDALEIVRLNNAQRKLLCQAQQTFDVKLLLKPDSVFSSLVQQIDRCFAREDRGVKWRDAGVFVRLSTVSPKDVVAESDSDSETDDSDGKTKAKPKARAEPTDDELLDPKKLQLAVFPSLKCHTTVQALARLVRSARVMDEIEECAAEDQDRFAIILKAWDMRIRSEREYRCLIYERELEAIIHEAAKELSDSDRKCIESWVVKHISLFPEATLALDLALHDLTAPVSAAAATDKAKDSKQSESAVEVIFVEFNSLDKELDTFGVDLDKLPLTSGFRALLHQRGHSDDEGQTQDD